MKSGYFWITFALISLLLVSLLTINFGTQAYSATNEPSVSVSAPPAITTLPSAPATKQEGSRSFSPGTLLLLGPLLIIAWFVRVFTRKMSTERIAPQAEITPLVTFCYVFTFIAFTMLVLPVVLVRFLGADTLVQSPVGIVKGCVATAGNNDWELACDKEVPSAKFQWVLNIGGSVTPEDAHDFQSVKVHGGLVVPWYFITLALVGAAVSLARRVPELQKKAITADSLNGPACREELEFQIFQVLSAPFVAITVYTIVMPSSLAVGATLGFASGFSSEAVLMGIRAGLEPILQYMDKRIKASTSSGPTVDEDIKAAVTDLLAKDQDLKDLQIQVSSSQGLVELTGTVKTEDLSKKAETLARSIKNVKDVTNAVKVKA